MDYTDWSELTCRVQPLARRLYEAMALRDWITAAKLAGELSDVSHELFKFSVKMEVKDPPPPTSDTDVEWYPVLYD